MRSTIQVFYIILMVLTYCSCQNSETHSVEIIEKDFGLLECLNDTLSVELNLAEFKTWKELLTRTEDIVCNDSLPKITLMKDSVIKSVYLKNPCPIGTGCILIKQRNIIEIHNDTISKWYYKEHYPLDSLAVILKRDLENHGKDSRFSDRPEKFLIYISYDDKEMDKLPILLDKLTLTFEQLSDKKHLNIWLNEKFDMPPPPPPPKEPEGIKLVEEEIKKYYNKI